MVLAIAAVLRRVGAVDVTGGAVLGADELGVGQVVNSLDGGVLRDNDHLDAGGVGGGEVHVDKPVLVDGDAGHGDVALAVLHGLQGGVEVHVVHHQLQAHLLGDQRGDLHVDALEAAVVGDHLIGREGCVGGHVQLAALHHQAADVNSIAAGGVAARGLGAVLAVGASAAVVAGAAAGGQGQHQGQGQNQRKYFFHFK